MARGPRIVAELGRPETADETAARKAASSAAYRSSKTVKNLVVALLVTLGVVAIIILIVPRGEIPQATIDVAATAETIEAGEGRDVVVPEVPDTWLVNRAGIESDTVRAWRIVYVPESREGFVTVAQGFDADEAWPSRLLQGAAVADTVTIDGVTWDRYDVDEGAGSSSITRALAAPAGADIVVVYGATDDASLEQAAASVADQVRELQEAS